MRIQLKIWRQPNQVKQGRLVDYDLPKVDPDMSFLEMLDMLNDQLSGREKDRWSSITTVARAFVASAES
jgi:succinate dehydrogenase iron-sulfur subunit